MWKSKQSGLRTETSSERLLAAIKTHIYQSSNVFWGILTCVSEYIFKKWSSSLQCQYVQYKYLPLWIQTGWSLTALDGLHPPSCLLLRLATSHFNHTKVTYKVNSQVDCWGNENVFFSTNKDATHIRTPHNQVHLFSCTLRQISTKQLAFKQVVVKHDLVAGSGSSYDFTTCCLPLISATYVNTSPGVHRERSEEEKPSSRRYNQGTLKTISTTLVWRRQACHSCPLSLKLPFLPSLQIPNCPGLHSHSHQMSEILRWTSVKIPVIRILLSSPRRLVQTDNGMPAMSTRLQPWTCLNRVKGRGGKMNGCL